LDSGLALAKVRIDLESELRRIAHEHGIIEPGQLVGVAELVRRLEGRNSAIDSLGYAINEVLRVANMSVHGVDIPQDTAGEVVRVADELVTTLRTVGKAETNHGIDIRRT
jgi:hypothetical protein